MLNFGQVETTFCEKRNRIIIFMLGAYGASPHSKLHRVVYARFTLQNCVTVIFPFQMVWPHRPATHKARGTARREKRILLFFPFSPPSSWCATEKFTRDGFHSFIRHFFSLLLAPHPPSSALDSFRFLHLVTFGPGFISPLISITFSARPCACSPLLRCDTHTESEFYTFCACRITRRRIITE